MSKKILKISSNQVLKQVFSNSQIANKNAEPQTFMRSISTLRGLEKPCGLFNPFEETLEDNIQDDIFMDMLLENEPNHRENDLSFNENMNPDSDQKLPLKKTSKFAKKVKDVSIFKSIQIRRIKKKQNPLKIIRNYFFIIIIWIRNFFKFFLFWWLIIQW